MDNQKSIQIYALNCGYYEGWGNNVKCRSSSPAGGVGCYIGFENKSKRTINRVTFTVIPLNADNQKVSCNNTGESEKELNYIHQLGPGRCSGEISWIDTWYNTDVKRFVVTGAEVEFGDGTVVQADASMLGKTTSGSLGNAGTAIRAMCIIFVLLLLIGCIFLCVKCSSSGSSSSSSSYNSYDSNDRYYSDDEIHNFVNSYDGKW